MASGMRLPQALGPPAAGNSSGSLIRRAESQEVGEAPGILVEGCRAEKWKRERWEVSDLL